MAIDPDYELRHAAEAMQRATRRLQSQQPPTGGRRMQRTDRLGPPGSARRPTTTKERTTMTDTPRESPDAILARLRKANGFAEDKAATAKADAWTGTAGDRIADALTVPSAPGYDTTDTGADVLQHLRNELTKNNGITIDAEQTRAWRESALTALGVDAIAKQDVQGRIG